MKYSDLSSLARLTLDLSIWDPSFGIYVLDSLLEEIKWGMEVNPFKWNQRRLSSIKFLGELCTIDCVDCQVILDTLWDMVLFGHRKLDIGLKL